MLVDPAGGDAIRLEDADVSPDGEIESGILRSDERRYEVRRGIARFTDEAGATATADSFSFKWSHRGGYEPESFRRWYTAWLLEKYGFVDLAAASSFFAGRATVLEIGCGSGLSAAVSQAGLGSGGRWVGIDLSDAVDIAQDRLGRHPDAAFVQADIMAAPFKAGTFDAIFTEGVLHHTPSTSLALEAATRLLKQGGEILFYLYARKAPVRERTDDYLRSVVSAMAPEEAWGQMRSLTSLARALAGLKGTVDVPEDVPLLGIKAGAQDVQRLIYWHFAKLFWNEDMGFEGSQTVNFDWYHPPHANRHTLTEIMGWCARLKLDMTYCHEQESGYTIRATKR